MEDYELAISFGNELVHHTCLVHPSYSQRCNYFPNGYIYNPMRVPRFNVSQALVEAVLNLMVLGRGDIIKCHEELKVATRGDAKIFAKLALEAAVCYFAAGYSHDAFLAYCATLIGVTVRAVREMGPDRGEGVVDAAAGVIGTVLFAHLLNGGCPGPAQWTEGMERVAEGFVKYSEPRMKDVKFKYAELEEMERRS